MSMTTNMTIAAITTMSMNIIMTTNMSIIMTTIMAMTAPAAAMITITTIIITIMQMKYSEEQLRDILKKLSEGDEYGIILRAKGIIPCTDGTWIHFDMVPEEFEIRRGDADYTGRLCVIGSHLDEEELAKLFGLA